MQGYQSVFEGYSGIYPVSPQTLIFSGGIMTGQQINYSTVALWLQGNGSGNGGIGRWAMYGTTTNGNIRFGLVELGLNSVTVDGASYTEFGSPGTWSLPYITPTPEPYFILPLLVAAAALIVVRRVRRRAFAEFSQP